MTFQYWKEFTDIIYPLLVHLFWACEMHSYSPIRYKYSMERFVQWDVTFLSCLHQPAWVNYNYCYGDHITVVWTVKHFATWTLRYPIYLIQWFWPYWLILQYRDSNINWSCDVANYCWERFKTKPAAWLPTSIT